LFRARAVDFVRGAPMGSQREASIAGGTEPGMARAAAERTTGLLHRHARGVVSCRKLEARRYAAVASVGIP
jgi:hypothetical protein